MPMDSFFKDLGGTVLERWKRVNFSLEKFPAIARTALEERPPSEHVELPTLMREFLLNDEQPLQSQSGFGQPEIIAYEHPRFYIQLLFWMEGTTDIHQHEFSGAFHVMHGSSIHALYDFDNGRAITPHLKVGDVRMRHIELLETGRTVPIISGQACIHSLFHLDTPSVTVVVRTQHDPGTGPQFNLLPPHLAIDPMHSDTLTMRRKQLLDVLEQVDSPDYAGLVCDMLADLDLERGFFILQNSMARLHELGRWKAALSVFRKKHGSKTTSVVVATLEEGVRRDGIKNLRSAIAEPEHRFFLALLMNVPTRTDLLKMVAKRFPQAPAAHTVLRWLQELGEETDYGITLLDAAFPESMPVAVEAQPEIFLTALQHFMSGSAKVHAVLRQLSAQELETLRQAFAHSSLRVLVA